MTNIIPQNIQFNYFNAGRNYYNVTTVLSYSEILDTPGISKLLQNEPPNNFSVWIDPAYSKTQCRQAIAQLEKLHKQKLETQ